MPWPRRRRAARPRRERNPPAPRAVPRVSLPLTEATGAAANERIQALPRAWSAATLLLFDAYCDDPAFAELYAAESRDALAGTLPIFRGIQASVSAIPGTTLGCFRGCELVGVVTFVADPKISLRALVLGMPIFGTLTILRHAFRNVRYRPRLSAVARRRWRAYRALAHAQDPPRPALRILALGVAPASRRSGVARRLLHAVEADVRWQASMDRIQVETWHESKVAIYERLGFETVARGTRDGVDCWTMVRPTGRGADRREGG